MRASKDWGASGSCSLTLWEFLSQNMSAEDFSVGSDVKCVLNVEA